MTSGNVRIGAKINKNPKKIIIKFLKKWVVVVVIVVLIVVVILNLILILIFQGSRWPFSGTREEGGRDAFIALGHLTPA